MHSSNSSLKKLQCLILSLCFIFVFIPVQAQASTTDELKVGNTYSGFQLTKQTDAKDIDSKILTFTHEKSGAHLVWIKNDDNNKAFSIGFRTPAYDDTGVNHIIEHTLLEGSEHYPVQSLFFQMQKKSLNNFQNAFTSADMTSFPFSTTNDKDFENLMNIYMDGVFFPNVLKNPLIFKQEGWHYELASKDSPLTYNGIVYNEDNGYSSSPDEQLATLVNKSLFPDTTYKYVSGGTPDAIPQLTYDKFLETYHKNYQPSNSCIYLYGNIDILKTLTTLDQNYLNKFDYKKVDTKINEQKPFNKPVTMTGYYSLPKGSDTKNKTYISLNYALDNSKDITALQILDYALLGNQNSPLNTAVSGAGLGNVQSSFSTDQLQPVYSITLANSNEASQAAFQKLVNTYFESIAKSGIDTKTLDGIITSYEINSRAKKIDAQRGMNYCWDILKAWRYDMDISSAMDSSSEINEIRKGFTKEYLKNLVDKYILKNNFSSTTVLKPKAGYEEELAASLTKKLADYKASLSSSQIDELIKQNSDLKAWHESPNTKEALATLPSLSLSDINQKANETPCEVTELSQIKILTHPMYTNDLAYMNMYFDASRVPQDKVQYLTLLVSLLGSVDTKKYKANDLANEITQNGLLNLKPTIINNAGDTKIFSPKVELSATTLKDKMPRLLEIIDELINNTKFDDTKYIGQMINAMNENLESSVQSSGMSISQCRDLSYFSPIYKYYDQINGLGYARFLQNLSKDYSKDPDKVCKTLAEVSKLVFNKNNLVVSITSNKENCNELVSDFKDFSKELNSTDAKSVLPYKFESSGKNEGLETASKVQYITKGYNFKDLGYEYNGNIGVLTNILNTDYLLPKIRVQGGAYGAGCAASTDGCFVFYSYDDPNLKETLTAFNDSITFLKNFQASAQEMNDYIIGAVATLDAPKAPDAVGEASDIQYMSGFTLADIQKYRTQLLSTKAEDIRAYADMLQKILEQNYVCIVGSSTKIDAEKDVFNSIDSILPTK